MLTHLSLRNFQCHDKLDIPLSQITTIVGGSDAGKSAIIRSLNFVCFNNLRGTSFITHGKDKCAVALEIDGQEIVRKRTKSSNSYSTETNEYSAVSSEVPPEIAQLLNIDAINVANQHDPLFWFSLTSGQLAKELNAIADIAWVDRVLQVSVSDLRKINAEVEVTNNRIAELEAEAKQTEWVTQADEELQKLEALETKIDRIAEANRKLTELIDRLESNQSKIRQLQAIIDDFTPVQKSYTAAESQRQKYTRIHSLLSSLPDIEPLQAAVDDFAPVQNAYTTADSHGQKYERIHSLLSSLPDIEPLQAAVDDFVPIQKAYVAADCTKQQYQRLTSLLSALPETIPQPVEVETLQKRLQNLISIESAQSRLTGLIAQNKEYGLQIRTLTQDLHDTEHELRERSEGKCPLCLTPLPS